MELIEQFTELESLLPTVDDLIKCGFSVDSTEKDLWHNTLMQLHRNIILLHLHCNKVKNDNNPFLQHENLFKKLAKKDCSLSNYVDSYMESMEYSVEENEIQICLRAMAVIFESKLQQIFQEYFELHNAKVIFWRQCFDKVLEFANTITAGERKRVVKEFIGSFKLENELIKCSNNYDYNTYLELVDNLSEQDITLYVSWCWKYYQKQKEMEEELSIIKHSPPHNNCSTL